jgi:hypothetical protein
VNWRLCLGACLMCACNRTERTNGASGAVVTATAVSSSSTPAGSSEASDAGTPPSVASGISSAASAVRPGTKRSVVAVGHTSRMRLESDALTYCDSRGGRLLDLVSGVESARERSCDHEWRNSSCDGIDFVDAVREPGPDDIIDAKEGPSFPVHGHIHDCAFSSGVLLVATGLEVVAIDVKTDRRDVKLKDGGNQVAINEAWIAWSDGRKVFAQRR